MRTSARLRASGFRQGLSPSARAVVLGLLLLGAPLAGVAGCGGQPQETPATEPATSGAAGGTAEGTSTITLNWDQQNNCVRFDPWTTTIEVGDRVNFNTSMDSSVTVHVPAGLFSAADTSIVVTRGSNPTSPGALAAGGYELTSTPAACASAAGGGGPSIIVDTGEGKPRP